MPWKAKPHRPQGWKPRASARDYERQHKAERSFYWSSRWREFRKWFLGQAANALCGECLKIGRTTPAVDVHHIKPRLDYPELAFEASNCEGLCHACHSRKTRAEDKGTSSHAGGAS